MRHNDIRDITADVLTEVCPSVSIEPTLQPFTGEQLHYLTANTEDDARADISTQGFWGDKQQRAFTGVQPSCTKLLQILHDCCVASYRRSENEKRWAYKQRIIEVEHGSFTPLVLSATGGMGQAV